MRTFLPGLIRGKLLATCLFVSLFGLLPYLANAAGTGYNMSYVNGIKTITLPEETAAFTPGPNVALVTQVCTGCHSADYPTTQPYQTRNEWLSVLEKMQNNYGMMPLGNTEQTLILDYLTTNYGR